MNEDTINAFNRKWSNMSLLYRVEQIKKDKARRSMSKSSIMIRRRSDYFYIDQAIGNIGVFLPDSIFREIWDIIAVILIIYQVIAIPYLLSYTSIHTESYFMLLLTCDCFFLIEIALNFNTGYFSDGTLVKRRKLIVSKYLRSSFISDFFGCLPLELFIQNMMFDSTRRIELDNAERIKYIWMLKFLNLFKLPRIINTFQYHFTHELTYTVFHLMKFLISAMMIVHWITCSMYLFFIKDLENTGMMWYQIYDTGKEPYLRYFYMTVFTMTSTGYGDILPFSNGQKILTIGIMCLSCWLFAFILTNSKDILLRYSAQDIFYKDVMSRMKKYMVKNSIQRNTRVKVLSYFKYLKDNSKKCSIGEDDILNTLSRPLREDIFVVTRGNFLRKCPFFKFYSFDFLRILIRSLRHAVFAPGDIIIKEYDLSNSIYFILKGRVEIFHERTQTSFKELNRKRYFGEISFFLPCPRSSSARSLVFSELLTLTRYELEGIVSKRPKDYEYHRLFTMQAFNNLALLGVRCYLCNNLGHIAKDCKKFVILINKSEFVKESDNRRYNQNQKVKKNKFEIETPNSLLKYLSHSNIIGQNFDPKELYKKSEGLKTRAQTYLKEDVILHYRASICANNIDDEDQEESSIEKESSRRNSVLPIDKQYTSQFLIKRNSAADSALFDKINRNISWEDDCQTELITFGNTTRHKSEYDIPNLFKSAFPYTFTYNSCVVYISYKPICNFFGRKAPQFFNNFSASSTKSNIFSNLPLKTNYLKY